MSGSPPTLLAWVDGRLLPPAEATVSVYDRGFRTGEGVFETLRAYGDHVFRLDAHLERAVAGATELGFDPGPRSRLADAVRATAAANLDALDGTDSALRLTVSAGEIAPASPIPGRPVGPATVAVTSHPLATPATTASAVTVPLARALPHVKALSHLPALAARRRARELDADEALLTDPAGRVLEGAGSNVFAVVDGQVRTPPLDAGLLAGVTRAVVLELARAAGLPVIERAPTVAQLQAADEALLTSTTRELVPLVAVDGRPVGTGRPGPVTGRLQAAYRDAVTRERAAATGR